MQKEKGQATVEYVLILALAISFATLLFQGLEPIFEEIADSYSQSLEQKFQRQLHHFPIRK